MKTKKEDAMNANTVLRFEEQSEEFLAAMQSGQPFEMDEESFYYWLEVLPPTYMGRVVKLPDGKSIRAHFGFAEGEEQITAFWRQDGRYFGCRTDEWNRI